MEIEESYRTVRRKISCSCECQVFWQVNHSVLFYAVYCGDFLNTMPKCLSRLPAFVFLRLKIQASRLEKVNSSLQLYQIALLCIATENRLRLKNWTILPRFAMQYVHGSQSVRRDALLRRFSFSRILHKCQLSAVLFIELITSAVLSLHQRTVIVQVQ